jgi:hypothetical protein
MAASDPPEVDMRSFKLRKWLMIGAVPSLAIAIAVPAAAGTGVAAQPARSAAPQLSGPPKTVIVVLRDQNSGVAARSKSRLDAVRAEQAPIISQLRSTGATGIASSSFLNAVIATVSPREAAALKADKAVAQVIPNGLIPGPSPAVAGSAPAAGAAPARTAAPCGTAAKPELDPQAITDINAVAAQKLGFDGAGVTVAYIADGVDPANPDFQRNAAYASSGSPAGSPVFKKYEDFSGDGPNAPTAGGEAFLDASSIAAQGNRTYDLSKFVNASHPLPAGCDIRIVGAAPGSDLLGLKVFGQTNDTTESNFLQAINYGVNHGAKVINESFGSNPFPDTALDVTRLANDAAVTAGVTVVVSSGDAGVTSTIGSPATDPNVISVGASTTYRAYAQTTYGAINDPKANGKYINNNISNLSSGGYSQSGGTIDLVAPGDLNWALCDASAKFADCTNFRAKPSNIEFTGGTSESAPLTSGAAADVIQAYASSHGGTDPTPAVVKQILVSTATDIDAPATEQGAGLLNVLAAVKLARSIQGTTATPTAGLLISPNQVNIVQRAQDAVTKKISLTNSGPSAVTVRLSTRALTKTVGSDSGSFCMQPSTPTSTCPANTGTFPRFDGTIQVYQNVSFTVPTSTGVSRLEFENDFTDTGQASPDHVALLEPNGTFAAYSEPQGLSDYADLEVANPPAGKWTAVFYTEKGAGAGTTGTIQWDARTLEFTSAGAVTPSSVSIPAGHRATVNFKVTSPKTAGDSSESVVVTTPTARTTIPVTVRTIVALTKSGGTFSGVLTGGNGRGGAPGQTNTYVFNVPKGERDLDVSVALSTDPQDTVIGYLVDPNGQVLAYSSNDTTDNFGTPIATPWVNLYHVDPQAGQWEVLLDWVNLVSGSELTEPFTGSIQFDQVHVTSNVPKSASDKLTAGKTYKFTVTVKDTGVAPEAFFVDPRWNKSATITLPDLTGSGKNIPLPIPAFTNPPLYIVPSNTTELKANLTGSVPVTFDLGGPTGDPDVSPEYPSPATTGSRHGDSAKLTLTEPQVSPGGPWDLFPDEIGPYPTTGAPAATATAILKAVTKQFAASVTSSTGDFWSFENGMSKTFDPVYVPSGDSSTITISVKVSGAAGTAFAGTLYVDDVTLAAQFGVAQPNADELAALPFAYTVSG